jgi:hypothetical protein
MKAGLVGGKLELGLPGRGLERLALLGRVRDDDDDARTHRRRSTVERS